MIRSNLVARNNDREAPPLSVNMTAPSGSLVTIIIGRQYKQPGGYYRIDKVQIDGQYLYGHLFISKRDDVLATTTVYGPISKPGHDVKWLAQQNEINLAARNRR